MRSSDIAAWMLGVGMSFDVTGLAAEPLPPPSVDYRVRAKAPQGIEMKVAHHEGRLRMDISSANFPGGMTSLINLGENDMIVLMDVPGMEGIAVEMDLPPGYAFADSGRQGTRTGTGEVVGEACDLWRIEVKAVNPSVESCITADGIVLRTSTTLEGKPVVLFEVTELERAPQDPAQFALPKGVKVTKLPSGVRSLLPGLLR